LQNSIKRIKANSFKKDLRSLLILTASAREEVAKNGVQLLTQRTSVQREKLTEKLAERFPEERSNFVGPLALAEFFAELFAADEGNQPIAGDNPQSIAFDLEAVGGVFPDDIENAKESFGTVLEVIKSAAQEIKPMLNARLYSQGVLPGLKSIGTTVESRAVFDQTYKLGDNLNGYDPKIVDKVAVASVKLTFTQTPTSSVSFQVNEEELAFLVDGLRAAQVELKKIIAEQS
jgi:hypothetical protein